MTLVSVKFKEDGKAYFFENDIEGISRDDYVLVETEKGIQLGKIFETNLNRDKLKLNSELKQVVKRATKIDYDKYLKNLSDAEKVLIDTRKKI